MHGHPAAGYLQPAPAASQDVPGQQQLCIPLYFFFANPFLITPQSGMTDSLLIEKATERIFERAAGYLAGLSTEGELGK